MFVCNVHHTPLPAFTSLNLRSCERFDSTFLSVLVFLVLRFHRHSSCADGTSRTLAKNTARTVLLQLLIAPAAFTVLSVSFLARFLKTVGVYPVLRYYSRTPVATCSFSTSNFRFLSKLIWICNMAAQAANPVPLRESNLEKLNKNVRVPSYERNPPGSPTIVHISVGGFHRAHQAAYLDDLLEAKQAEKWRLVGVGLLPFDIPAKNAMKAQDCLYTLVNRDASSDEARIIAAVHQYLYAPEQSEEVIRTMADLSCKIVSLTITEGGYFIHQGTGKFNVDHPDIQHDLNNLDKPRSSFGYILAALRRRKEKGIPPFAVLSCDNLQHNGDIAKEMITAFAQVISPDLAAWLDKNGAFPNCMVDGITPATTDEHRKLVREKFGVEDQWPVTAEKWRQWVIEDNFPLGRPAWEKVGAEITHDVVPYEFMKLRLLNASHQALCYIGMLKGYRYAPEAMADPDIVKLLRRQMDEEVTQHVPPVPGVNFEKYKAALIERFANPAVNDQLLRIGTEGSARIAKFVLPALRDALAKNTQIKFLCFTVASWGFYLAQKADETGQPLGFIDPMLDRVQSAAVGGKESPDSLLGVDEVFGDLAGNQRFVAQVGEILRDFHALGSKATLSKWVSA